MVLLLGLSSGCSRQEQEGWTDGTGDSRPVALRIGGVSAGAVVTRSQSTLLNSPGDKISLFLQAPPVMRLYATGSLPTALLSGHLLKGW